jgi:rhodanese-related sulfurtransferase
MLHESLPRENDMPTTLQDMLAAANAAVPRLDGAQVRALAKRGDVLFLDVRDAPEIAPTGKIKGALHVPRGMLELRADPDSSGHDRALQKDRTIVVYCGSGVRAALSGKTLKDLGYANVYNGGGFKDLADSGFETE